MKTVAVFFGGTSVEHDVSVITGVLTLNSVDKEKYSCVPVYVDNDGVWYTGELLHDLDEYRKLDLKKLKRVTLVGGENVLYEIKGKKLKPIAAIAVAINCMHGERGEDGCLFGLLSLCKIPLASPSLLPSAVSMDKAFTKTVMRGLKIKTLPYVLASEEEHLKKAEKTFDYPMIVKPTRLGSSIGVNVANDYESLKNALNYALRFCDSAIIEPCLEDFREINCAAYLSENGEVVVSECERPIGRTEILSFSDKYEGGSRVFPADIDAKTAHKIKKVTETVYKELNFTGVIRIDYFLKESDVYLNEINSVPGSLSYYLFGDTLVEFTKMLNVLIRVAERNFAADSSEQSTYDSGILRAAGIKGAKHL